MTEHLVLAGPSDISAAVARSDLAGPGRAAAAARRVVARRARALGVGHLVPVQWLRAPDRPDPAPDPARARAREPAPPLAAAGDPLTALARRSGVPLEALRTAYMRGVRDYAMTSPHSRPPAALGRDAVATARAAALARRAAGDPTARDDDDDLLNAIGAQSR